MGEHDGQNSEQHTSTVTMAEAVLAYRRRRADAFGVPLRVVASKAVEGQARCQAMLELLGRVGYPPRLPFQPDCCAIPIRGRLSSDWWPFDLSFAEPQRERFRISSSLEAEIVG
jgi:hypothetical protein